MKLSIITVCYNEKDVSQTCQSIITQTWQDFEWIVIDGGSEQWCIEILEKYRTKMSYFVSEKDNGIYDAMNKGIAQAKGEYLLFLNAGDFLYDNKVLEDVYAENKFNSDIIFGQEHAYKIHGADFDFTDKFFWTKENYKLRHQATFVKKDLFSKYGVYDTTYKSAADFERFLNFLYINNCSSTYINRIIDYYKDWDGMSSEAYLIGHNDIANILNKYNMVKRKSKLKVILKSVKYLIPYGLIILYTNVKKRVL